MTETPASLPAIHAHHLTELVQRWQVEPAELLEGLGLTQEDLTQPDRRLEIPVFRELIRRAKSLTGEPGLGIYFGPVALVNGRPVVGYRDEAAWHDLLDEEILALLAEEQ